MKTLEYPVEFDTDTLTVTTAFGATGAVTIPAGTSYARLIWSADPGDAYAQWDGSEVEWLGESGLGWTMYEGGFGPPLKADLAMDFKSANGSLAATPVTFSPVK